MTQHITAPATLAALAGPAGGDAYEDYRRAELLLETRRPAEAATLLTELAEEDRQETAVLELLGRALFASAQLGGAEKVFRQLVDRRPDEGWARLALARTLERRGRREEAGEHRRLAAALGVAK